MQSDQSLVWYSEVPGDVTTLTIAKAVFANQPIRVAIETFYRFEDQFKKSCLTPKVDFKVADGAASKALGAVAFSPDILFKFDSLANGSYDGRTVLVGFQHWSG